MSMMKNIADALNGAGIPTFMPGRHEGKCLSAYAVVADGGVTRLGKTTGRHSYLVTVCVPMAKPSLMTETLGTARTAMAGLSALRQSAEQSPDMIDEAAEAYCVSLEYDALCGL